MYKLAALDVDGTLLNSKLDMTQRTKEVIYKAYKKGVRIVISTGRTLQGGRPYTRMLGIEDIIIACNGAYIVDIKSGREIFKSVMPLSICKKILDIVHSENVYFHTYVGDVMYVEKLFDLAKKFKEKNKHLKKEDRLRINVVKDVYMEFNNNGLNPFKFVVASDAPDKLMRIKNKISSLGGLDLTSSHNNNFEINLEGINKGNALKKISESLNIKREEMIAIGDNTNDLSMIEYAGMGIAMGNAMDEVKKAADMVTKGNDEDGVAWALEKLILKT